MRKPLPRWGSSFETLCSALLKAKTVLFPLLTTSKNKFESDFIDTGFNNCISDENSTLPSLFVGIKSISVIS